jgi:ADP-ribose pyrophosphatase
MTLRAWSLSSIDVISRHFPFDVLAGRYRRDDGFEKEMTTLHCPEWANIFALTPSNEVVLVRQYRPGPREITLELPGGIVDAGEDMARAAQRELFEETGFEAAQVEALGWSYPNPALQDNRIHHFFAPIATPKGPAPFDGEGEECEVVLAPLSELDQLVRDGHLRHGLCLAAIAKARARFPAVFSDERAG